MLRITTTHRDGTAWVALEGSLAGPWIEELDAALAAAHAEGLPLALDLASVRFADRRGIDYLRRQAALGRVQRSSGFVNELLRRREET